MPEPTPACPAIDLPRVLALDEFIVLAAQVAGDDVAIVVELPRDVQPCPRCGEITIHRLVERRLHRVRHLPIAGRRCTVVWAKRRLSCINGCGRFNEVSCAIAPRAVWTTAARRQAVAEVAANRPVEHVRRDFGVGWSTVMRAVLDAAEQLEPADPDRVGLDETKMTSGRYAVRARGWVVALVDLSTSLVVEVAQGRSCAVAERLLADHAPNATVVACDLFGGFKTAAEVLDGAVVVADRFHLVRLAIAKLDQVRRRRQQELHRRRGQVGDPLYDLRRVLRVRRDRLDDRTVASIFARLRRADTDDQVASAWTAVELLCDVYRADDRDDAHRRLVGLFEFIAAVDVDELNVLGRVLDTWTDELLAWFDTGGASNGPSESANVKVKNVRRCARGFSSFPNYRARILLHAGRPRSLRSASVLRGRHASAA